MRRGLGRGRRGPSLLGSVARTALIAGTASSVAGRVSENRQSAVQERQERAEAQQQLAELQQQARIDAHVAAALERQQPAQAPVAAAAASPDELITQLTRLGELRDAGLLTDDEFATQKSRILGT
jgi:Short C-terminal domain